MLQELPDFCLDERQIIIIKSHWDYYSLLWSGTEPTQYAQYKSSSTNNLFVNEHIARCSEIYKIASSVIYV